MKLSPLPPTLALPSTVHPQNRGQLQALANQKAKDEKMGNVRVYQTPHFAPDSVRYTVTAPLRTSDLPSYTQAGGKHSVQRLLGSPNDACTPAKTV